VTDYYRSKKVSDSYALHRASGIMDDGCVLCKAQTLADFSFWKVIPNNYPYDLIAETHNMLVPKRHITDSELSVEEIEELKNIKNSKELQHYQYFIEANNNFKSIPQHYHLHLIVGKNLNPQ